MDIGNGLGDFVLALIQHGGDVLNVGQRLVDRILILRDEIIQPYNKALALFITAGPLEQALTAPRSASITGIGFSVVATRKGESGVPAVI